MSVTPYTSGTSAGLKSSLNSPLTSSLSPGKLPALIKSETVQTLHGRLGSLAGLLTDSWDKTLLEEAVL